jgi:competence protein ComEC
MMSRVYMSHENARAAVIGLLFFLTLFVWSIVLQNERGLLTVVFFDVGQGDAIFIEGPNGGQVLIDGGSNNKVLQSLSRYMPFYDRSIDVVIATHPDKDHIGGLPSVLKRFDVDFVFRSGAVNDTGTYSELNNLIGEKEVREVIARKGTIIQLGGGAYAEILFPDRDVSAVDPNDASIFLRVVYGESEFLFSGDAPQKIENYVAGIYGENIDSDVLKVGHHGSKTSSSEFFLSAISPQYGIVSASVDNSYGHPHREVLDRFRQFEIPILSTAEEGDIVFYSDGEVLMRRK